MNKNRTLKRLWLPIAFSLMCGSVNAVTFIEDPIDRPLAFVGVAYSNSFAGAA